MVNRLIDILGIPIQYDFVATIIVAVMFFACFLVVLNGIIAVMYTIFDGRR